MHTLAAIRKTRYPEPASGIVSGVPVAGWFFYEEEI
jgi:hypothetical protein